MDPSWLLKNHKTEDFMIDNNYYCWAYTNIVNNEKSRKKNKNKNTKSPFLLDNEPRSKAIATTTRGEKAPSCEKDRKGPCKYCLESKCRYKSHLCSFQPSEPIQHGPTTKLTKKSAPSSLTTNGQHGRGQQDSAYVAAVNVYMTNQNVDHLGRHDMLTWVNDCMGSNFGNIEELKSGAVYCQFMDMLFPGSVPMKKIRFQTTCDSDCEDNFELLQAAFHDLQVDKIVPTDKLVQGRFLDNFTFLQWFKKFVVANYNGRPYDAVAARKGVAFGVQSRNQSEIVWQSVSIIPNSNKPSSLSTPRPQQQKEQTVVGSHRQACQRGWCYSTNPRK